MKTFSAIACSLILTLASAFATSRTYSTIDQLIVQSDIIALVTVSESNDTNRIQRSQTQPYGIASLVKIKKKIKGIIPDTFLVYHMSGLDDCLFQQGTGDYLVFLRKNADFYIPSDGCPSSKFIEDAKVSGWSYIHSFQDYQKLQKVLNEIETKIKANQALHPTAFMPGVPPVMIPAYAGTGCG